MNKENTNIVQTVNNAIELATKKASSIHFRETRTGNYLETTPFRSLKALIQSIKTRSRLYNGRGDNVETFKNDKAVIQAITGKQSKMIVGTYLTPITLVNFARNVNASLDLSINPENLTARDVVSIVKFASIHVGILAYVPSKRANAREKKEKAKEVNSEKVSINVDKLTKDSVAKLPYKQRQTVAHSLGLPFIGIKGDELTKAIQKAM